MDRKFFNEALAYDSESGTLTWKARPAHHFPSASACARWNSNFAGKSAGHTCKQGYRRIEIGSSRFAAHRVIWLMLFGRLPEAIDHINGNRADNRLCNLRSVTVAENNRNIARRRDNKSGTTGVDWKKALGRWRAQIAVDGRDIHLGYFDTKDAAVAARKHAEQQHGFHINHGAGGR